MKLLPYIAAAIFLTLWLMSTCSGPEETFDLERELQYQRQHAIDSIKLVESGARFDSISSRLVDTVRVVIVKAEAKDKEIRVLKSRLAKTRAEVQPSLDTIPTLNAFVEQQDSLINFQSEQIESLRGGMYQISKDLNAMIGEQEVNSRIAAEMLQSCEARREEMKVENRKQMRKERKKTKLAVIGGAVAVLATLVLSQ